MSIFLACVSCLVFVPICQRSMHDPQWFQSSSDVDKTEAEDDGDTCFLLHSSPMFPVLPESMKDIARPGRATKSEEQKRIDEMHNERTEHSKRIKSQEEKRRAPERNQRFHIACFPGFAVQSGVTQNLARSFQQPEMQHR
ncbi:hypothetical protein K227x_31540 [Rubripirellula lacrimiformis]|uniref:Uncharacterized protein n=1 Tax=Rubripirellula lacrimiformis TaxID=1930273 RepID=A0A517NCI0_9BACT|nr:hypothetical protein K227x_31540 [Rubripirellula lacrimiformis]